MTVRAGGAEGELGTDAGSIDTGNKRRDRHLRSPNFFDVERQPRIVFAATAATARDGILTVTGELATGSSRVPLEIPVSVEQVADGALCVEGKTTVSREALGLGWNMLGTIHRDAVLHARLTLHLASAHLASATPRNQSACGAGVARVARSTFQLASVPRSLRIARASGRPSATVDRRAPRPEGSRMTHRIVTADGRRVQVLERGVADGRPVLVHNGTPNSSLLFEADVRLAERQGIRMISYDRPGYGGSDRDIGRSVASCARDVRAIADALEIERLAVWGISGGGPHALACAALLPDLVPAVAVLASIAPWPAEGLDYFDGMGRENVEDIELMLDDRTAGRAKHEQDRHEALAATPETLYTTFETLLSPVDRAALTPNFAEYLYEATQLGLAPGADGWWDDDLAFLNPWGFELDEIRTPVLLLHGRQDRFVPFAHGEWLARHIPGVDARLLADEGHLTLIEHHLETVHEWLLARLG